MSRIFVWLKGVASSLAVAALLFCGSQVNAGQVLTYNFDNVFSGTSPDGVGPWATVTLQDVNPGTVSLTFASQSISSTEKISELYLNITSAYDPTALKFNLVTGTTGVTAPQPLLGEDSFKADGDGKYDILFQFSQLPSSSFGGGDSVQYTITGVSTLTVQDFLCMSSPAGGHGPFFSAIHVQGITSTSVTDTSTYSGWVSPGTTDTSVTLTTIPEPGSLALLVFAGGFGWVTRRRLLR